MVFTKLSEENKQLINNCKEQYGNENVGSYRALLMREKSSSDAINIINSRKKHQTSCTNSTSNHGKAKATNQESKSRSSRTSSC